MRKCFPVQVALLLACLLGVITPKANALGVPFFISTTKISGNAALDEQVLRFLATQGSLVILDAQSQPKVGDSYTDIVRRLHQINPKLPIFLYTWATRWVDTPRIGTTTLTDYPNLGSALLHDKNGNIQQSRNGDLIYGDVRQAVYRKWVASRIRQMLDETGTNGVMLDMVLRNPLVYNLCADQPACAEYAQGVDRLLTEIKHDIHPKKLIFNGLWNQPGFSLDDQARLLQYADGASIEFFGYKTSSKSYMNDSEWIAYAQTISDNPGKDILVYGRSPKEYMNYDEDFQLQRFLYSNYLLLSNERTFYKYLATFLFPSRQGRSDALDIYSDWQVDLGMPLGEQFATGAVRARKFTKGLVLVGLSESGSGGYRLERPMYSPEGQRYEGLIKVPVGQALILLNDPFVEKSRTSVLFREPHSFWYGWPAASFHENAEGEFLRLSALTQDKSWQHDFFLEPVRHMHNPPVLVMQLRLSATSVAVLAVAEVDDSMKIRHEVVIRIPFQADEELPREGEWIMYRTSNAPGKTAYVNYVLPPEGQLGYWRTLKLNGESILANTGRYRFKKWKFVRPLGDVDIKEMALSAE